MKKVLIFFFICWILSLTTFGQDDPDAIGYRLKVPNKVVLKVYQDKNGSPNTDIWNQWIYNYWFKVDESKDGTKKIGDVEYIRITVPSGYKYNRSTKLYEPEPRFKNAEEWKQEGIPIDSDDFNSWLWITKADFDKYKKDAYPKVARQLVFSGLTIPFKYRLKTNSQTSSILSGDVNLGTFLGLRLAFGNTGGLSLGASLGLTSLTQNSSNNSAVAEKKTELISGINYGFGTVFDWQKKFQLGAILGYDHGVGDLSKTYLYQDQKWLAISFNYKFLDFAKGKTEVTQPDVKK